MPSSDPESDEELLGYIEQKVVKERGKLPGCGFANKIDGLEQRLRVSFLYNYQLH